MGVLNRSKFVCQKYLDGAKRVRKLEEKRSINELAKLRLEISLLRLLLHLS